MPQAEAAGERQRQRSLSSTVFRTTLANVAVPVSAIVTGPLLARYLGPAERGALAAVLTPLQVVTMLLTFGMPEAVSYFVAGRRAPLERVLRLGLLIGLISGLLASAAIVLLAPVLLHSAPQYIGLMRWMCLLVIWSMVLAAVRAFAAGRRRFDLTNAERWLSVISRLPLLVLVAILGGLTVESAALITYGTGAASMLVLLLVLREPSVPATGTEPLWGRRLLSFGSQAWIGTIGSYLVLRVDQALIAPLVGVAQLGYYAVAVSLAEVPSTLQLAMRDVMFVTATDRNDPYLIARGSRVLLIVTTGLAVIGAVLTPIALPLLFGSDFRPAVHMAQILLFAGIPAGITMVVGAGLMSAGRPRSRALAQLAGLAVNVALLFVLVPPLGAIGASWTALVSYTLIACLIVALFARHTPVKARECVVPRRDDVRMLRALAARILDRLTGVIRRPR